MKVLYLNPQSGIAGDMLVGALLDLGADTPEFWQQLRSPALPADEWNVSAEPVVKRGISATKFNVSFQKHTGDHHHGRHLSTILKLIKQSTMSEGAKAMAAKAFQLLAHAEAAVHDTTPEKIHFHEVGAVDAIADICGACIALAELEVDRVIAAPPALGGGTVSCDHGVMAVPVPAVCKLMEGAPMKLGPIDCELTTPTGAALLRAMVDEFSDTAVGAVLASGYGAGTREFEDRANVLPAMLLNSDDTSADVAVLECNLDDITGEQLAHAGESLLAAGALDYTILPCTMKKGRPGHLLQVLCAPAVAEQITTAMLRSTTSFGVRRHDCRRTILDRESIQVDTRFGPVSVKIGRTPDGDIIQVSPEYIDCKVAAENTQAQYKEVFDEALCNARNILSSG